MYNFNIIKLKHQPARTCMIVYEKLKVKVNKLCDITLKRNHSPYHLLMVEYRVVERLDL